MASEGLRFIWETNCIISLLIVCIYLTKPFVKRTFDPTVAYRFWAIVPLALLVPFLASGLTAFRAAMVESVALFDFQESNERLSEASHSVIPTRPVETALQIAQGETFTHALLLIWLTGGLFVFGAFALRQWALHRSLGDLTLSEAGYYVSRTSAIGPALIGVFRPKIVVPKDFATRFNASEKAMIIAHEQTHYRSADTLVNAAASVFQCIFWFNPLVHMAAHRLRLDQEMSCDARVLKQFPKQKKQYAKLLLGTQLFQPGAPLGAFWPATSTLNLKQRLQSLRVSVEASPSSRAICLTILATVFGLGIGAAIGSRYIPTDLPGFARLSSVATAREQALLAAVQAGNIEQTADLLRRGADPDVSIPPFGTPLIVAAKDGNLGMVKALVSGGSTINLASRGQGFPLFAAIENEHIMVATYLISMGARPNTRVPEQDASPLSIASQNGSLPMVELLLDHGADPNMVVDDEGTPLIAAATSGQIDTVEILVRAGADIKRSARVERRSQGTGNRSHENTTALAEARRFGQAEVIDFLEGEKHGWILPDP